MRAYPASGALADGRLPTGLGDLFGALVDTLAPDQLEVVAAVAGEQWLLRAVASSLLVCHQILRYVAALSARTGLRPAARIVCHFGCLRTELSLALRHLGIPRLCLFDWHLDSC